MVAQHFWLADIGNL